MDLHRVALVGDDHGFFALIDHAHGPSGQQSQFRDLGRDLIKLIILTAERAPHRRLDNAHIFLPEAKDLA
jgi:hypothetical protein